MDKAVTISFNVPTLPVAQPRPRATVIGGRPESECGCYACRLRRLVIENENLRRQIRDLVDAVADMRHAQREYFRTKSQSALTAAKRAEQRADKLIARVVEPQLF